jgi:hypothetical protein
MMKFKGVGRKIRQLIIVLSTLLLVRGAFELRYLGDTATWMVTPPMQWPGALARSCHR